MFLLKNIWALKKKSHEYNILQKLETALTCIENSANSSVIYIVRINYLYLDIHILNTSSYKVWKPKKQKEYIVKIWNCISVILRIEWKP